MAKWEYLTVQIGYFGFSNDKIAPRFENGGELRDWKRIDLQTYLNNLGRAGWEMSGTMSTLTSTVYPLLFFKRSIP